MQAGSAENNVRNLSEIRQSRLFNKGEIHKTEPKNTIRNFHTILPTKYLLPWLMKATQPASFTE